MRIMAVDAVVLHLRTTTQIPVAIHATVSTMRERLSLLAVALRTKRHHVFITNGAAISQPQSVGFIRIVAGVTGDVSVVERHSLVKLIECRHRLVFEIGLANAVTG